MFRPWDKAPSRQHQGACVKTEGKGLKGETELMLVVLTPSKDHNIKSVHTDSQKVNQFADPHMDLIHSQSEKQMATKQLNHRQCDAADAPPPGTPWLPHWYKSALSLIRHLSTSAP